MAEILEALPWPLRITAVLFNIGAIIMIKDQNISLLGAAIWLIYSSG